MKKAWKENKKDLAVRGAMVNVGGAAGIATNDTASKDTRVGSGVGAAFLEATGLIPAQCKIRI
jgi:hypothetical protein